MSSIKSLKKLVKNSSKTSSKFTFVVFRIADESEESGNQCMWNVDDVTFTKFCIVHNYKGQPYEAVPYWKVCRPHLYRSNNIFFGLKEY